MKKETNKACDMESTLVENNQKQMHNRIIEERHQTHGSFVVGSRVSQGLKEVVRNEYGYKKLDRIHREALDNMFGKIGRIIAGKHDFDDHWEDCSNYARLPLLFNHGRKSNLS